MLTMCILRRCGEKFEQKHANVRSGIHKCYPSDCRLRAREQSLFKLLIFPLVWRLYCQLMDLGLLPTLKRHGDILGYIIVTTIVGFCFSTEGYSNRRRLQGMIRGYG
jgi:hypothetical protein